MILIFSLGALGTGFLFLLFGVYSLFKGITLVNLVLGISSCIIGLIISYTNAKFMFEFLYPREATRFYTRNETKVNYNPNFDVKLEVSDFELPDTIDNNNNFKLVNKTISKDSPFEVIDSDKLEDTLTFKQGYQVFKNDKLLLTIATDEVANPDIYIWKENVSENPVIFPITNNNKDKRSMSFSNLTVLSSKDILFTYDARSNQSPNFYHIDILKQKINKYNLAKSEPLSLNLNYKYIESINLNTKKSLITISTKPVPLHSTSKTPSEVKFYLFDKEMGNFDHLLDLPIRVGHYSRSYFINNILYLQTYDFFSGKDPRVLEVNLKSVL